MARLQTRIKPDVLKINSNVLFGMNLRQVICSVLAIVSAGVSYFALKDFIGTQASTYVCAIFALFFAFLGFFNYNGLTADKFLLAVWKDLNAPKVLVHKSTNTCYEITKKYQKEKEEYEEYEEYINSKNGGAKKRNKEQSPGKDNGPSAD